MKLFPDQTNAFIVSDVMLKKKIVLVALHSSKFPLIGESHGVCAIAGYLRNVFPDILVRTCDMQLMSIDEICLLIQNEMPAIVGVSVKLFTFEILLELHKLILSCVPYDKRPLIVLGNAVPTFDGQTILRNYLPEVIIGMGEGEFVIADLYRYVSGQLQLEEVRNIMYIDRKGIHETKRGFLDGSDVAQPDRSNSADFYLRGAEIYAEASRGCAYGACSFCVTKDLLGSRNGTGMWRPRPIGKVVDDLEELYEIGVREVTFADEDFFGLGMDGISRAIALAHAISSSNLKIFFRVNARVKSIFNLSDSIMERSQRDTAILALREVGLVKVFLGLEAGVDSQLKRYGKGFILEEFREARDTLKRYYIETECGFILIDPLMNLSELRSSLVFLEREGLLNEISSVFKELRINAATPYIDFLRHAEIRTGITILGDFDINSQEYRVLRYLDGDVDFIARVVRVWVGFAYRLYYKLRITTQYSTRMGPVSQRRVIVHKICVNTIAIMRLMEYDLLKTIVALVEEYGHDWIKVSEILARFEVSRCLAIENLSALIRPDCHFVDTAGLCQEISDYCSKSKDIIVTMSDPCSLKRVTTPKYGDE